MTAQERIWLSSPHMGGTEENYVDEAFRTNWIAPLGPNVNAFEHSLEAHFSGAKHVAALSSGTAAIHLALVQLGVGKGDEVICQSLTFSASANPIDYVGATPVFVDSEWDTYNICPVHLREAIEHRLNAGVKPKAIVAVHLYGMPYKADEIQAISEEYSIPVLEDSAEALGSSLHGKACGSFGEYGVLSFNGNKIITTSGGGALVCPSEEKKKEVVYLSTQARDEAPHYQHSVIGYNYRMSNILAGIGVGQMEVLQDRVDARRANFKMYSDSFGSREDLDFLKEPEGYYSNRWLSTVMTPSFDFRENIRHGLWEDNIESRPIWKPMHLQPVFKDHLYFGSGVSEEIFERGLCLPSGSNLRDDEKQRVLDKLAKILG